MKAIYLYFSFRHNKKVDRMIVSVAGYADPDGKRMLTLRTSEVRPWDNNNYVKMIQCYANALNYIYDMQDAFANSGFTHAVLMTDNKILHSWIEKGESHGHAKWFKAANKPFRAGSTKEIGMHVALGVRAERDLAYKYCKTEYVDAKLEMTYRGIKIVTDEEATAKNEKVDSADVKTFSVDDLLAMDEMADNVDISGFIG